MLQLTYIHGLMMRTDAVGGSRGEAMAERGSIISVNGAKIMGGKFGRSNIFVTHSLTHSLTHYIS